MSTTEHLGKELTLPTDESIKQLFVESESAAALVYAFPERLVKCFRTGDKDAAPSLLNEDSVERELALSALAVLPNQVAFRQEAISGTTSIVNYDFLGDVPGQITPEVMELAGSEFPVKAASEFNAVFEPHYRHVQAYCGWLLQQAVYWDDLKAVVNLISEPLLSKIFAINGVYRAWQPWICRCRCNRNLLQQVSTPQTPIQRVSHRSCPTFFRWFLKVHSLPRSRVRELVFRPRIWMNGRQSLLFHLAKRRRSIGMRVNFVFNITGEYYCSVIRRSFANENRQLKRLLGDISTLTPPSFVETHKRWRS